MLKRSWLEIDLSQIVANYTAFKSYLAPKQDIMAVIKADAYGHGSCAIAKRLQSIGCTNFAVSNIEEAIVLREAGINGQILILGYTPISYSKELRHYDITQALLSETYAKALSSKEIKAQFAINTGMNRIGLDATELGHCEEIIRDYYRQYNLTGLFTHLCVADTPSDNDFTLNQIKAFKDVVKTVSDLKLPYIHCMNSAGGMWHKPYGNLVRLGIILYGLKPSYTNTLPDEIKPVVQWKSVISMVKTVFPGESIGYGRTFLVKSKMRIAIIPTGYADGYNRLLSNKGFVFIRGKKAPIVGRICMDQITVDVTNIPEANFEDEVTLLDNSFDADDMAHLIDTIGYEIVCGISRRVSRIYLN